MKEESKKRINYNKTRFNRCMEGIFKDLRDTNFPGNLETCLIFNLAHFDTEGDQIGWKTRKQIIDTHKNIYGTSLKFSSDWANLDNIMNKLIAKGLVKSKPDKGDEPKKWILRRDNDVPMRILGIITLLQSKAIERDSKILKWLNNDTYSERQDYMRGVLYSLADFVEKFKKTSYYTMTIKHKYEKYSLMEIRGMINRKYSIALLMCDFYRDLLKNIDGCIESKFPDVEMLKPYLFDREEEERKNKEASR